MDLGWCSHYNDWAMDWRTEESCFYFFKVSLRTIAALTINQSVNQDQPTSPTNVQNSCNCII